MKVAVIGAGNWGKNLVRTYSQLGALEAVVDTDPQILANIVADYREVKAYHDFNDALSDQVDGLVVATPAPTHYNLAQRALRAGKDVFVEKPLAMTADEAEELVILAAKYNRILMVGHLLLYQPAICFIKELVDAGEIGELRFMHQERMKLGRVRSVENVLWSFGVHDVAVLAYLIGARPQLVTAKGHCALQPGIEDDVHLDLLYPGNVSAHLHVSWLWPERRRRLTVVGSKGMLVYDETLQRVHLHHKSIDHQLQNMDGGSEVVFEGAGEPLKLECQHFLECVARRERPISDGESAVEVVRVLEEAQAQLKGDRP